MDNTTNTVTVIENHSVIAMPVYGRAFGMLACASADGTDASVTRDRQVKAVRTGAFPGTSAWRPPIC